MFTVLVTCSANMDIPALYSVVDNSVQQKYSE